MELTLGVVILIAGGVLAAAAYAQTRVSRTVHGMEARLRRAPKPRDVAARLPEKVRDFALRAGATPDDLAIGVRFTQLAEMQLKPGQPWQPLDARQAVAIGAAGFVWQASQSLGPVTKFRVIDGYLDGAGSLRVWLLGLIPVLRAEGPDIDRGEAMRYLAELPWAPDAILGNPGLAWRMEDDGWAAVSMDLADGPVTVRLRFDSDGDIAEAYAPDRPARDAAGKVTAREWQGFFRDYRMIGPRRIPAEAEVGYTGKDGFRPYFQCRIIDYSAAH